MAFMTAWLLDTKMISYSEGFMRKICKKARQAEHGPIQTNHTEPLKQSDEGHMAHDVANGY